MKTINEIIQEMTYEEQKQHSYLIKECLNRDAEIKKCSKQSKENLLKLTKTLTKIIKDVEKIDLTLKPTNEKVH